MVYGPNCLVKLVLQVDAPASFEDPIWLSEAVDMEMPDVGIDARHCVRMVEAGGRRSALLCYRRPILPRAIHAPAPSKEQIRLNGGLSRAYLELLLGGGCMAGDSIGRYDYSRLQSWVAIVAPPQGF